MLFTGHVFISQHKVYVCVNGLSGTVYGVSTHVLENGIPFPRVVTQPKNVTLAIEDDQGLWT